MGNPYFDGSFQCTVNPFEEYNSNVVNRFTKLIASYPNDQDCIFSGDRVEVTLDSTSEVTISAGTLFKDDVFIKLLNDISVDFSDPAYYIGGASFNKTGYYYVTIRYVYDKTKPAPRPRVTILTSDQRDLFTDEYILLKVADVHYSTYRWIDSLWDYDPERLANKRVFSKLQIGIVDTLPIFNPLTDYGRVVFSLTDKLGYYGGGIPGAWTELGGSVGSVCPDLNTKQLADDLYTLGQSQLACSGIGILSTSIESQLSNIRSYAGAVDENDTDPLYTSITSIVQSSSLTAAISALDLESEYIRDFIGKTAAGNSMPTYISDEIISNNDDHTLALGKLDQFTERLRTYIGKPDYTAALPVYTSATTITSGTPLLTAVIDLDRESSFIRTYTGKIAAGGTGYESPVYSSTRSISSATSLKTAISALDLSIGYTDLIKIITLGHSERNSATPSILEPPGSGKYCGTIYFDNSIATSVTNIVGGPSGSNSAIILILHFSNSLTTIVHGITIQLEGSRNFIGTLGAVLTLVRYGNVWYEVSRCDRDVSKTVKLIESKHVHVTTQPGAVTAPIPTWFIPVTPTWNNPADTSITFTLTSLTTCEFVFSASDCFWLNPGAPVNDSYQWLYARLTIDGTPISQYAVSHWVGGSTNIHQLTFNGAPVPNFHWIQDVVAGVHTVKVQFMEDGFAGGNLQLSERSFSIFKIE
jgi:hypothetical protein